MKMIPIRKTARSICFIGMCLFQVSRLSGQLAMSSQGATDDFESYANDAAVQTVWQGKAHVDSSFKPHDLIPAGTPGAGNQDLKGQALRVRNQIVLRDLGAQLSGDVKLSFTALHSTYQRALWVGLLDAQGRKGVAVHWDASTPNNADGNGFVSLVKYELDSPLDDWKTERKGEKLAPSVHGVHPATGYRVLESRGIEVAAASFDPNWKGFARFELIRQASTGRWMVRMNGVPILEAASPDMHSLRQIVVIGTGNSFFDNITVEFADQP
jgi:hypothetical protein